ncbi:MAG: hypothetical protein Q4G43_12670 [Mobilicoccus sp.]|nr:hypothetical protein [Mobilicoccus sp.]
MIRPRSAALALSVALIAPATAAFSAPGTPPTPVPITTPSDQRTPPAPGATPVGGPGLAGEGLLTDLPPGVPEPPDLPAGAYLVADLDDGRVILAKHPHLQSRPASTLKTLTALVIAANLDPATAIEAEFEDVAIDGSKVGMVEDEEYTVHQLLQALMLNSGNDAANALARANGGMERTAAQMNDLAEHLGALDTFAVNTSGLDAPGQMTSVYDLALIGRAAVEDPVVAPYLVEKIAQFPGRRTDGPGSRRERYEINNHNRLLWNYEGTIGVKNGYTQAARQTYIGAVRRDDQAYVITYLGGTSVGWRDTAALLDWAFDHGQVAGALGHLVPPGSLVEPEDTPEELPTDAAADEQRDGGGDETEETAIALDQLDLTSAPGIIAIAGAAAAIFVAGIVLMSRRRTH